MATWFKNKYVAAGIIATAKLTVAPAIPVCTAAAEASQTIAVAIQMKDPDGNNVARACKLLCESYKADVSAAVTASDFRLSETGVGSEVSTTAKPSLIIQTDANGAATLSVLDQTGAYTGTMYVVIRPIDTFGSEKVVTLTFA